MTRPLLTLYAVEQRVDVPVIWDTVPLMWHHIIELPAASK